jgi:hypothetical protein
MSKRCRTGDKMVTMQSSRITLEQKQSNFAKLRDKILAGNGAERISEIMDALFDLVKKDADYAVIAVKDQDLPIMLDFKQDVTLVHQAVRYHIEAATEALNYPGKLRVVNAAGKSVLSDILDNYTIRLGRKFNMRA